MTLDPVRYECPEHRTDLTSLVREALEYDGPPVAYLRTLRRRQSAPKQFQVIVACPGENGTGAHSVTCAGKLTR
jgi:hypothetical protein